MTYDAECDVLAQLLRLAETPEPDGDLTFPRFFLNLFPLTEGDELRDAWLDVRVAYVGWQNARYHTERTRAHAHLVRRLDDLLDYLPSRHPRGTRLVTRVDHYTLNGTHHVPNLEVSCPACDVMPQERIAGARW